MNRHDQDRGAFLRETERRYGETGLSGMQALLDKVSDLEIQCEGRIGLRFEPRAGSIILTDSLGKLSTADFEQKEFAITTQALDACGGGWKIQLYDESQGVVRASFEAVRLTFDALQVPNLLSALLKPQD